MTAQYASPDTIGDTSPAVTATMASSRRRIPARSSRSSMRHSPMETMEKFCRSASAYRVAMVSACSETARERTKSPAE